MSGASTGGELLPSEASEPAPWLPLLRELTERSPLWGVWKNADAAIAGRGDIDSSSPPEDRALILEAFARWATAHDMGPLFSCAHLPGSQLAVAVRGRELVELQLNERALVRGATLFTARELQPTMEVDARGVRRLRPGAEGFLLIFHVVMGPGGRYAPVGSKHEAIVGMLRDDPEGVELASRIFGPVQRSSLDIATALVDGRWDRAAAVRVEAWVTATGLKDPRLWLSWARLHVTPDDRRCPLLVVLRRGRRIPGDAEAWLRDLRRWHPRFD